MADVFAEADEAALARFGLGAPVQHVPPEKMGAILAALGISAGSGGNPGTVIAAGGGSANAAKIAALLGISSGFIGVTGREGPRADPMGRLFEEELSRAGTALFLNRSDKPTGVCLYLRDPSGKTRICASPGADLAPGDIPEDMIRQAKVVVPDGYLLGRTRLIRRIFGLARKYGKVVALDAGSADLAAAKAETLRRYCRDSRNRLILFMNEAEAAAFCSAAAAGRRRLRDRRRQDRRGDRPEGLSCHMEASLLALTMSGRLGDKGRPFPVIAVKLGERGAAVYAGGKVFREKTDPVVPREPTGAGDAFAGAFLAAWLRGGTAGACAALGNKTARAVLDAPGTSIQYFAEGRQNAQAGHARSFGASVK
jgi:ribokinase